MTLLLLVPLWTMGTASPPVSMESLMERLEAAEARVSTAEAKIADLTAEQDIDWMSQARTEQVRNIVQDVLADADTRASLQGSGATAGYDNGFFIRSSDGNWSLKINGVFQERFNVGHQSGSSDPTTHTLPTGGTFTLNGGSSQPIDGGYNTGFGFETTRMALDFSGEIKKKVFFDARIDWSPYNGGGFNNEFTNANFWSVTPGPGGTFRLDYAGTHRGGGISNGPIEWAYAGWKVAESTRIQIGRQKFDVMRGFIVKAEDQQAIERSMQTYYWDTSSITNGIKLIEEQEKARFNVMFGNGSTANGSNNSWSVNQHGWAVTGRGELLLGGTWDQFDRIGSTTADNPGVLAGIGAGYLRNENQSRDNWIVSGDLSYQANGWNAYGSVTAGNNDNGVGTDLNNIVDAATGTSGFNGFADNDGTSVGFELGVGMKLNENTELYSRWQWLSPGIGASSTLLSLDGDPSAKINMLSIGANHWLAGPNVKLSIDWTWSFTDPSAAMIYGNGAWGYTGWWSSTNGLTTGSMWLLRTQLQVGF